MLQGVLSAMHVVLWKFIVIAMTRMSLENAKWKSRQIWVQTVWRTRTRVVARTEIHRLWMLAREGKGEPVPSTVRERWNRELHPFASYDDMDQLTWHIDFEEASKL